MAAASKFALLVDLAKEPSSRKRRELLRAVTDLFFETEHERGAREQALFDEVLRALALSVEEDVLAELSHRFADTPHAPAGLVHDLARRSAPVAEAVLRRSPALQEGELIAIVESQGQEHARAVAQRREVSAPLSAAIVRKGDDETVEILMRNTGARLDRETFETVVERAQTSARLQESVVMRPDLDLDLLNELYFAVEHRLRTQILARNQAVEPAALEAALTRARTRAKRAFQLATAEARAARAFIAERKARGDLTESLIISLYRDRRLVEFLHGLAAVTEAEFDIVRRVVADSDLDLLATICKAAGLERAFFVTLAVLICDGPNATARAEEYGRIYAQVPAEAARRAMRFMAVRRASPEVDEEAPEPPTPALPAPVARFGR